MEKKYLRLLSLLICIVCYVAFNAQAQNFEQDLMFLRQALHNANKSAKQVSDFRNPYNGTSKFRLSTKDAPWAGNYFAMENGGAANRWQIEKSAFPFPDQFKTKYELFKMTIDQISLLSPIEKYDILMGDYQYRATLHELTKRGPLRPLPVANWEGFCNGVRCASENTKEPIFSIDIPNPDGILVRFQPADLKALISISYFFVEKYAQLGSPSKYALGESRPNAAVFDIALRYFLANKKRAFVIDSHLGAEIWNESVIGFERNLSTPLPLFDWEKVNFPMASHKILVDGWLDTLGEVDIEKTNQETKSMVAHGNLHGNLKISYVLYTDSSGEIIDGTWNSSADNRGVDFAWFGSGKGTDSDPKNQYGNGNPFLSFKKIKSLIQKSHRPPRCSKALGAF